MKSLARSLSKSHVGAGLLAGFFLVLLTYFTMSERFTIRAPNLFSHPSIEHEIVSTPSTQDVEQEEFKASGDVQEPKSDHFKKEEKKKIPESFENTQQLGSCFPEDKAIKEEFQQWMIDRTNPGGRGEGD